MVFESVTLVSNQKELRRVDLVHYLDSLNRILEGNTCNHEDEVHIIEGSQILGVGNVDGLVESWRIKVYKSSLIVSEDLLDRLSGVVDSNL